MRTNRPGSAAVEDDAAILDAESSRTGAPTDAPGYRHMWSIITWPKPEHETWVAPGISRAKS